MDYASIGKHIRECRVRKGLRQEEAAELVGLSTNYYGSIERGEKIPALETFLAILNGLEMSADYAMSDVLKVGYTAKNAALDERMKNLPEDERSRIYEVLEVMLQHAERRNRP
jgi:transcriptional regulator with XRE-family HTH domain